MVLWHGMLPPPDGSVRHSVTMRLTRPGSRSMRLPGWKMHVPHFSDSTCTRSSRNTSWYSGILGLRVPLAPVAGTLGHAPARRHDVDGLLTHAVRTVCPYGPTAAAGWRRDRVEPEPGLATQHVAQ